MPAGVEANISELLGLRLLRAFQTLQSDWERLRAVEYLEALNTRAETDAGSVIRLVASNLERDEQNDRAPGKII
jgi:hypothetical protein